MSKPNEPTVRRTEVKVFREELVCGEDGCGEVMRHSGYTLTSYPPQFPMVCKNEHKYTVRGQFSPYPHTVYEPDIKFDVDREDV